MQRAFEAILLWADLRPFWCATHWLAQYRLPTVNTCRPDCSSITSHRTGFCEGVLPLLVLIIDWDQLSKYHQIQVCLTPFLPAKGIFSRKSWSSQLIYPLWLPQKQSTVQRKMSGTVSKSSTTKSSKYVYRSTGGAGADVTIEYSTDLSALARLEVLFSFHLNNYFLPYANNLLPVCSVQQLSASILIKEKNAI